MSVNVEQIVRDNIEKTIHLSLGTVSNGKPWVSEVHFAYDDDLNLYYRSLSSRRHSQEIAQSPSVAGDIVKQHSLDEYPLGIYFEGTAKMLKPGEEQDRAFAAIKTRLAANDNILEEAKDPNGHQFYMITVDTYYVFGKLDDQGGKKYELKWNGGRK